MHLPRLFQTDVRQREAAAREPVAGRSRADGSGPKGEEAPDPGPGDDRQRELYLAIGATVSELMPAQQVFRGTARPEVRANNCAANGEGFESSGSLKLDDHGSSNSLVVII